MQHPVATRPAGTWALDAGRSTTLSPTRCGYLCVKGSRLRANGAAMAAGDCLRVWPGERVQLSNPFGSAPAYFSWDPCARQLPQGD